jgi:peptidyl-tRNA hydrolase, PTH1 family
MVTRVLVVGLGNLTHPFTRHRQVPFFQSSSCPAYPPPSIGQLALDSLSIRFGVHLSPDSRGGYYAESQIDINGSPFIIGLYKTSVCIGPCVARLCFLLTCCPNQDAAMNISGPPVSTVLRRTARAPSSLIVIHDSLEHKPAVLSQKFGGSANGHNGIRSLISALGTKDFYRLRLGIGRPESDVASYVLARLPNFERQFWTSDGPGLDLLWEKIQKIALQVDQVSS